MTDKKIRNMRKPELQALFEETNDNISEIKTSADEIKTLHKSAEDALQTINDRKTDIENDKDTFESLREEAEEKHTDLINQHTTLQTEISDTKTKCGEIDKLYKELLEDVEILEEASDDSDEGKEAKKTQIKSIKTKINELHASSQKKLNDIIEEHENQSLSFKNLKKELTSEIRSLFPEAASAGLGHAFFDAKKRFGSVPYEPASKKASRFQASLHWMKYVIQNNARTVFFYIIFMAPIIYVFLLFEGLQIDDVDANQLLFKTLLSLPLGFISYFGFNSIRQNRRLYEEYNHKQRVMQFYVGFKDEIDESTPELKRKLYDVMLSTVSYKPSQGLKETDRKTDDIIDQIVSKLSFEQPVSKPMVSVTPVIQRQDTEKKVDE